MVIWADTPRTSAQMVDSRPEAWHFGELAHGLLGWLTTLRELKVPSGIAPLTASKLQPRWFNATPMHRFHGTWPVHHWWQKSAITAVANDTMIKDSHIASSATAAPVARWTLLCHMLTAQQPVTSTSPAPSRKSQAKPVTKPPEKSKAFSKSPKNYKKHSCTVADPNFVTDFTLSSIGVILILPSLPSKSMPSLHLRRLSSSMKSSSRQAPWSSHVLAVYLVQGKFCNQYW